MWSRLWPLLIIVGSNSLYHICAKETGNKANTFASLAVTYLVAAVMSLLFFYLTADNKNIIYHLRKVNVATYALGISIVGLEFGYICFYRSGWPVSVGNLVASISLSCVLLLVGLFFYHDHISLRQAIGIVTCVIGMRLIL